MQECEIIELDKGCNTHIFLRNFVSIQPRSLPKNCKVLKNVAKVGRSHSLHLESPACEAARSNLQKEFTTASSAQLAASLLVLEAEKKVADCVPMSRRPGQSFKAGSRLYR